MRVKFSLCILALISSTIAIIAVDIQIDRNSRGSHGVYVQGIYIENNHGGLIRVDPSNDKSKEGWWRIGQDSDNPMWRINGANLQNSPDFIISNGNFLQAIFPHDFGNGHTATIEQIVCLEGINTTNNDYAKHITCAPIDRNSRGSHSTYIRGKKFDDNHVIMDGTSQKWWKIAQDDNDPLGRIRSVWHLGQDALNTCHDFIISNGSSIGFNDNPTIEQIACLEGINIANDDYAKHVTCAPIDRNSRGSHSTYIRGKKFDDNHVIMDGTSQKWWKIAQDDNDPLGRIRSVWHLGNDALNTCHDFIISNGSSIGFNDNPTIEQIVCAEGINTAHDPAIIEVSKNIKCINIDRHSRGSHSLYVQGTYVENNIRFDSANDKNKEEWWQIAQDNNITSLMGRLTPELQNSQKFIISNGNFLCNSFPGDCGNGHTATIEQIACFDGIVTSNNPAVIEASKNIKCVGIDQNSKGTYGTYVRGIYTENRIRVDSNSDKWWRIGQDDSNILWRINKTGLQDSQDFIISNGSFYGNGTPHSIEEINAHEGILLTLNPVAISMLAKTTCTDCTILQKVPEAEATFSQTETSDSLNTLMNATKDYARCRGFDPDKSSLRMIITDFNTNFETYAQNCAKQKTMIPPLQTSSEITELLGTSGHACRDCNTVQNVSKAVSKFSQNKSTNDFEDLITNLKSYAQCRGFDPNKVSTRLITNDLNANLKTYTEGCLTKKKPLMLIPPPKDIAKSLVNLGDKAINGLADAASKCAGQPINCAQDAAKKISDAAQSVANAAASVASKASSAWHKATSWL